ncbi:hypothetical protein [Micrococcus sp.]|uniref:hypothetical protein n=1 Tax=Micrococcus sp. TaxID=1271 RepID=UPI002A91CE71|nr:hypothetical protein [Micrococcus sp.]MDY6055182.1 hypothetical protein [Micrococcus sp.]
MRGPLARLRQSRADDRELGTGLWRRGHDRFARALERYWQVVLDERSASTLTPEQRNGVVHAGNVLAEALPRVRRLCARLRATHPGDDEQRVPPAAADAHRELSRASHELAATAQAAAMFRLGQGSSDAVGRHAERTLAHVARAEALSGRA